MHVHILGICGTFMGGLALIARQLGYRVTGSDQNVYPPMSTQLEQSGIELFEGYTQSVLELKPDQIVVGNVMTRGHGVIEAMLAQGLPLMSGPAWLYEHVLHKRWVIAVSGTHGKTTTTAMMASILQQQGLNPGYLVGGVVNGLGGSARLGAEPFFVIEADEYDTAFFDKRSKFIHYRPRTLVINNIEFDHADIFDDLRDIQKQFHHLIKLLPAQGRLIVNDDDANVTELLSFGCWSEQETFGKSVKCDWPVDLQDNGRLCIKRQSSKENVDSGMPFFGAHNFYNATAAIAACRHVGVNVADSVKALGKFSGVKRRLEHKGNYAGVSVYDDFAHHPTEIEATLTAFRQRYPSQRIIAVFEPRSNSMQMGAHRAALAHSFQHADLVFALQSENMRWSIADSFGESALTLKPSVDELVDELASRLKAQDCVLIMSNGSFGGLCAKLIAQLQARQNA